MLYYLSLLHENYVKTQYSLMRSKSKYPQMNKSRQENYNPIFLSYLLLTSKCIEFSGLNLNKILSYAQYNKNRTQMKRCYYKDLINEENKSIQQVHISPQSYNDIANKAKKKKKKNYHRYDS